MTEQSYSAQHYEAALLDAAINKGAAAEIVAKLDKSDFSIRFRPFFEVLCDLLGRGIDPDIVTVLNECEAMDRGAELRDTFVESVLALPGEIRKVDTYCAELKRLATARKLREFALSVSHWASEEDPDTAYELASKALMDLKGEKSDDALRSMNEMLRSTLEEIEAQFESPGEFDGLATGYEYLDQRWCGLKPHNLIYIAGRPAMGKTTLAMNIAEHNVREGKTVLFFSMEMSHNELMKKTLSSAGRLSFTRLTTAKLWEDDWPKVSAATNILKDKPLFVDDRGGVSVAQMRARAYQIKNKHGLDLVVADYIQLMRGEGQNRETEIGGISRGLKQLAKELEVPVIVISQLNRQCEQRTDKRPLMADLRDSGSLEQDANILAFVYRDEVYNDETELKGMAEIITRKFRGGKVGTDLLAWHGDYQRFDNVDHNIDIDDIVERQQESGRRRKSKDF